MKILRGKVGTCRTRRFRTIGSALAEPNLQPNLSGGSPLPSLRLSPEPDAQPINRPPLLKTESRLELNYPARQATR